MEDSIISKIHNVDRDIDDANKGQNDSVNQTQKGQQEKQKQVVLGVIKNAQGKILIVSRTYPERTSNGQVLTWAFPGGTIQQGETPQEALLREVKEETGYEVLVKEQISERDFPGLNAHLKYFACDPVRVKTSVIEETHEIDRIKWVDPKDLKNYFTTDMDLQVAKYLGL